MKTIEQVFEVNDLDQQVVEVPEWDTELHVASVTGSERAEIETFWTRKPAPTPEQIRVFVLARTLKSEDWSKPWATEEQLQTLMKEKNAKPLERAFEAALDICAFGEKDVEKLEGN